jgi:hypothetical protein
VRWFRRLLCALLLIPAREVLATRFAQKHLRKHYSRTNTGRNRKEGCKKATDLDSRFPICSRNLKMSVRFFPAPNQPIDAIGDPKEGESGASDGTRRTAETIVPGTWASSTTKNVSDNIGQAGRHAARVS